MAVQPEELLHRIIQALSEVKTFPYVISAGPYDFWQKFKDVDREDVKSGLVLAIEEGLLDGKSRRLVASQGSALKIAIYGVTLRGKNFIAPATESKTSKKKPIGFRPPHE